MKLTPKQAQELIILVQKAQVAEFFKQLQNLKIETNEVHRFEQEFTFGRFHFDFYERLQVYINSIANTKYDVIQPKYDVFFSFSSKNVVEAEEIVAFLRKCGVRVFFSNDDLNQHAGTTFISKINEALKTAKHFLLLCTPNAIASNYVLYECETFLRIYIESRKERRIFILKGENFAMNLLKNVHFENIQISEKEAVIYALGKKIPKDDLLERIEDYKELFELFYKDQVITDIERKRLQKQQQDLDLTYTQITEIENSVREELKLEKERLQEKIFVKEKIEKEHANKQEEILWQSAKENDLIKSYQNYLDKYRNGKYTSDAKSRINQLEQAEKQKQQLKKEYLERELLKKNTEKADWQKAQNDNKSHDRSTDLFGIVKDNKLKVNTKLYSEDNVLKYQCENCNNKIAKPKPPNVVFYIFFILFMLEVVGCYFIFTNFWLFLASFIVLLLISLICLGSNFVNSPVICTKCSHKNYDGLKISENINNKLKK